MRVSERSPRFPAATSNPNSFPPMPVFVQDGSTCPGAHVARTRFFQEEVSHGREAFGMTPNQVGFAVFEFCEGGELTEHLNNGGIKDNDKFWRVASHLASGVADIHRAGLVHFDIKVPSAACARAIVLSH